MESLNDSKQLPQMRVIIADDEAKARNRLTEMIKQIPEVSLCAEAVDGIDALEAIEREKPDVALLDIQMPGLDAFEVLNELSGPRIPLVIFVTGYNQYAIKAFDVSAVDYLLKPFSIDRLRQALEKAGKIMAIDAVQSGEIALQQISRLVKALSQEKAYYITRVATKRGSKLQSILVSSIQAFQSEDKFAWAVTDQGRFWVNHSLKDLETLLDPNHFVRVHRQYLINMTHVTEVDPGLNGGDPTAKLACGLSLEVSRRYVSLLKEKMGR